MVPAKVCTLCRGLGWTDVEVYKMVASGEGSEIKAISTLVRQPERGIQKSLFNCPKCYFKSHTQTYYKRYLVFARYPLLLYSDSLNIFSYDQTDRPINVEVTSRQPILIFLLIYPYTIIYYVD